MSNPTLAEQLLALSEDAALSLDESSSSVLARVDGTTLYMSSPYKKSAVPALGKDGLGGKWHKETKEWSFPIHWFEKVRDTYRDQFGTAGMKTTTLISATVDLDKYMADAYPSRMSEEGMERRGLYIMGDRPVAFYKTDQGPSPEVRLIANVTVVQGGFYLDGDDPKTMEVRPYPATVLSISELDMRATVRAVSDLMSVHGTPKSKAIQLFGGDAGTVPTDIPAPAPAPKAIDRVDDSLKDKAKEFETLLMPIARTIVDRSVPQAVMDKLLSDHGFERT